MINIRPITESDMDGLTGTAAYGGMTPEDKLLMVQESMRGDHDGKYFRMLTVLDGDTVVGFVNLYAPSGPQVVNIGLDTIEKYRGRGYASAAGKLALEYARDQGFSIACATISSDNTASLALNRHMEFVEIAEYTNKRGVLVKKLVKSLDRL